MTSSARPTVTATSEMLPALQGLIEEVVEGWFLDEPLRGEEFLDRLEGYTYPQQGIVFPSQMDDPVILAVLKQARKVKRELNA